MSSKGRLLRKLRKVMGVAVASSSLFACSSQSSCAKNDTYEVIYESGKDSPGLGLKYDESVKILRISGLDIIPAECGSRMQDDSWWIFDEVEWINIRNVENIGTCSFSLCKTLMGVTLDDKVKVIGDKAFDSCYNLKEIVIPKGITNIDQSAFEDCSRMKKVVILGTDANGAKIGKYAFRGCENLESLTIPNSISEIGDAAFANTNLTKIKVLGDPANNKSLLEKLRKTIVPRYGEIIEFKRWAADDLGITYEVLRKKADQTNEALREKADQTNEALRKKANQNLNRTDQGVWKPRIPLRYLGTWDVLEWERVLENSPFF